MPRQRKAQYGRDISQVLTFVLASIDLAVFRAQQTSFAEDALRLSAIASHLDIDDASSEMPSEESRSLIWQLREEANSLLFDLDANGPIGGYWALKQATYELGRLCNRVPRPRRVTRISVEPDPVPQTQGDKHALDRDS